MRGWFARLVSFFDRPAGISIGRIGTQSLSLVTAPIIAQAIGPAGRGETAAAIAAITITGVLVGTGVPLAVRRRAVLSESREDLIRTARVFAWLTAVPSAGIGLALATTLLQALDPISLVSFVVAMVCAALTVSWTIDTQVLVADQRYFRILWLGSVQTVSYFVVVVVLWLCGLMSVASVIWAYTAGTIAAFILGRIWVRARRGKVSNLRALLREGVRLWGSQAAEVASARLDQLLVLPIIGAAPAGIYSVAATLGALPVSVGVGMGVQAFRGFVLEGSREKIAAAVRAATAIAFSLAAVVAVASIWGVPLVFGHDFAAAVPLVFVTLIGGICAVGNYVCSMALVARNLGWRMTAVQVCGLVIGIGLLFPFGHAWGSLGAAVASSIGFLATYLMAVAALRMPYHKVFPLPADFRAGVRLFLGRS